MKVPVLQLPTDTQICAGTMVMIDAGAGNCTYSGTMGVHSSQILVEDPGVYPVYAYNQCGSDVGMINVTTYLCDILIPNMFTPNGDGINDFLNMPGIENGVWIIRIYNRWGHKLFEGTDPLQWNAERLTEGTYYYVAESKMGLPQRTGFVEIFR
ncbi:MAG: hypothetical protein CVU05_05310 [Bacteroidetes bacterium HGW-Bacteroidetes-21]|nr:MAG: hypothetical protein CVU05_05310 [Bacteroidetes bacterium HGW-Bacteroidetes-21]